MNIDFDEAVEQLRGLRDMCVGLSVSELVEEHDQHIFGLIGDTLDNVIPAINEKYAKCLIRLREIGVSGRDLKK